MHPALSIVFFTSTSGLGYGLAALALALPALGVGEAGAPERPVAVIVALVLVTAGLLSSTLHLANPRNAWRSFMRVRTSWLSREAVLAMVFYPVAIGWLVAAERAPGGAGTALLALLTVVVAIATVWATAMIYACLRTIRQWHTPLVPVNFLLIALMLGVLGIASLRGAMGGEIGLHAGAGIGLVAAALVAKLVWLADNRLPRGPTVNTAIGFRLATVRLLDVGHSGPSFLTREFGYEVPRARLVALRLAMIVLAYLAPGALLVVVLSGSGGALAAHLALVSAWLGVLLERWLFFAEARHVVTLYHGKDRT